MTSQVMGYNRIEYFAYVSVPGQVVSLFLTVKAVSVFVTVQYVLVFVTGQGQCILIFETVQVVSALVTDLHVSVVGNWSRCINIGNRSV